MYFVAGSQKNLIGIFKVSIVSGKQRDLVPSKTTDGDSDMDADNSDSDEDSEDEEEGGSVTPVLQLRKVARGGCINRIRAMTQNSHICASWSDAGYVQSENEVPRGASSVFNQAPLFNFKGHKDEGYAIDWSPRVAGRLVTGDCKNCIHLWEPASDATWNVDAAPFTGHTASVEDLQWCPTEDHVFASCSVDGHIAIWDARLGKSPAIYFKAHSADVNCHVGSGIDDGTFSIHDLRLLSPKSKIGIIQLHFRITLAGLDTVLGQKDLKELQWHAQIPGMIVSTASDGFNILMPSNIQSTLPSEGV
ncbi:transducin family protein [Salix suchowensis]|nr:transducin family protein [Salix suchowensis]